ncbi:MAG TPA: vWA domain-containing protein [Steroidobacteraceae bacterium]|jgi:mxaC protein
MSSSFAFEQPWFLLLLPLALLPLWPAGRDALSFAAVSWLPADRAGRIAGLLWSTFAVIALASLVIALAEPGRPQTEVARTGRGAEILVLMDRSRSMDDHMLPNDWRKLDPSARLSLQDSGPPKSQMARDLLAKFVAQRTDDRFSLMFFSTRPLSVVPFTQHDAAMQAGIIAGGIGHGLADTDVGRALIAGIGEFDQRAYSGSRIIMLVSDGGSDLDDATRDRIRKALTRNRIALYWIYLRSYNSPLLEDTDPRQAGAPEIALHRFFQTLHTPYRAYQAEEPEDLAKAVADVGHEQNSPLDFTELVPKLSYTRYFLGAAAFSCLMLLLYRALLLRSWQ